MRHVFYRFDWSRGIRAFSQNQYAVGGPGGRTHLWLANICPHRDCGHRHIGSYIKKNTLSVSRFNFLHRHHSEFRHFADFCNRTRRAIDEPRKLQPPLHIVNFAIGYNPPDIFNAPDFCSQFQFSVEPLKREATPFLFDRKLIYARR